jgi:hypothetical protein
MGDVRTHVEMFVLGPVLDISEYDLAFGIIFVGHISGVPKARLELASAYRGYK